MTQIYSEKHWLKAQRMGALLVAEKLQLAMERIPASNWEPRHTLKVKRNVALALAQGYEDALAEMKA